MRINEYSFFFNVQQKLRVYKMNQFNDNNYNLE